MTSQNQPERSSRRMAAVVAAVVAVGGLALAVWWFTRPAADTVDINDALAGAGDEATATDTPATSPPAASATGAAETPTDDTTGDTTDGATEGGASTSGTWTVTTDAVAYDFAAAEGTFVGFRVDEELSSVGATEAVGRTPVVTGELSLDDAVLEEAMFTADLTQITSDRSRREGAIQRALNTGEHPEATFELGEPVDLDEVPPPGEAIEVDVTGDLTVNGTTVTDTFPLQAGLTPDGLMVVTGSFDLLLADVGVDAPSAAIVVSVSDTATVEFQLYLQP